MARSEARVSVSIWDDPDFRALTVSPQRTYLFLISQKDLGHTGVLPLRERRWARTAAGLEMSDIVADLKELEAGRFVVVDEDTEEVFVRSLMRRDKVYRQPNVLRAAADHVTQIESPTIRTALLLEMQRVLASGDVPEGSLQVFLQMMATLEGVDGTDDTSTGTPSGTPSKYPSTGSSLNPSTASPGERGVVTAVSSASPNPEPQAPTPSSSSEIGEDLDDEADPEDDGYQPRDDVKRVCDYLADAIKANGSKRPHVGKRWYEAARLMLDRDKRSVEQVIRCIDWCQGDEFWRSNIMSMPTLRKQYDRLRLAAQSGIRRVGSDATQRPSTTDQRVGAGLALAEKFRAEERAALAAVSQQSQLPIGA